MVRLVATCAPCASRFGAAEIFGAGKLVAAVVDYVVARKPGCNEGAQLRNLYLHDDCGKNQESFQKIGRDHDAQWNQTEGRLPGQTPF
jgi:hypothetical protein